MYDFQQSQHILFIEKLGLYSWWKSRFLEVFISVLADRRNPMIYTTLSQIIHWISLVHYVRAWED